MRPPAPIARPAAALAAAALAAPTVLAFFQGGYFEGPRDAALVVAGVLLAFAAVAAPAPLPRCAPVVTAFAAFAALAAWTALSVGWAPLDDAAWATFERDVLYLAALAVAVLLLRPRTVARRVEPALALGALVVVGYGLSGRLVPTIAHVTSSVSAGGRLDQPLTYWNAMGALAAIGVVLCARMGGDATRSAAVRCAAAGVAVPLAVGVYLTFSRGALVACAAGLVVLLASAPTFTQLRAAAIAVEAGAVGIAAAAAFPAVRHGHGSHAAAQGALALLGLVAAVVLAAALQRWACTVEDAGRTRLGRLPLPRHHNRIAAGLVVAMLAVPVALAAGRPGPGANDPRFGASASRLASTDSPRYQYWKVALRAFGDAPLKGVGAGGFAVEWLRERAELRPARDAHSLPIETLAELGLVGAAALAVLAGAVAVAARDVLAHDPQLAAGPVAALTAYAVHAGIDWDWEMPALTLVAVVLAGALLGAVPLARATSASTATAASTTSAGSTATRRRVEP